MTSYALFISPGGPSRPAPPGLCRVQAGACLTLFASVGLSWLRGSRALLIGKLYHRCTHLPVRGGEQVDAILGLTPSQLLQTYWGQYVLARETDGGSVEVLRDPSGAQPCFAGRSGGEPFLVSDAGMADILGLVDGSRPDPQGIVNWLQFPFLRGARTTLAGIDELVPGSLLQLGSREYRTTPVWNPAPFATSPGHRADPDAFRQLVTDCVTAQVDGRPAVLQLSGGLDSSIVAACLSHSGAKLTAVTFATRSRDGDEVEWARLVAERFGIELSIVREDDDPRLPPPFLSFRPGANLLMVAIDRLLENHRLQVGADLLLDGGGGDSLFGYSATAAPVVDGFIAGQGWRTAGSVAAHSGSSWWRVLRAALRQAKRAPAYDWQADCTFIKPSALLRAPDPHPWLANIATLLPGKAEHLASLVHIQHFLDRHAIGGDHLHPLFCQPLIKACLKIPSWQWNAEGQDRLVARRAFADLLPPQIVSRQTKGSLEGFIHRRFDMLKPSLTALLLDGELAASGLVDAATIEAALCGPVDGPAKMRLSEIATLEHWLGSWRSANG